MTEKPDYAFDFEKLEVYQLGLIFLDDAFNTPATLDRRLHSSLGDQFQRAALSVLNNIAEGSRKSPKEKVRFYGFSLDSARECIPIITVMKRRGIIDEHEHAELRNKCVRLCKMLYRLLDSRKTVN